MDTLLIQEIIELAGGQTALAGVCSTPKKPITQSHVWNWLNRDKKIPPRHAIPIETMCAKKGRPDINRYSMFPEIFGISDTTAA